MVLLWVSRGLRSRCIADVEVEMVGGRRDTARAALRGLLCGVHHFGSSRSLRWPSDHRRTWLFLRWQCMRQRNRSTRRNLISAASAEEKCLTIHRFQCRDRARSPITAGRPAWQASEPLGKTMKVLTILGFVSALLLLSGCVSGVDNPNLSSPITDTTKAEITGFKIAGDGPMPDRIWVTRVDGKLLRQFAADTTIKIWPVEPGVRKLEANYFGAVGKFVPKSFGVTTVIQADLKAGVRYILKAELRGEVIVFWVEEATSGRKIAESAPLQRDFFKVYVPVPAS